eukprot:1251748-Amphidinium_carterae.2
MATKTRHKPQSGLRPLLVASAMPVVISGCMLPTQPRLMMTDWRKGKRNLDKDEWSNSLLPNNRHKETP